MQWMMPEANLELGAVVLALYYLVLGVLSLYGVHRSYLVWLYLRHRHRRVELPPQPAEWPKVTVQLPLYNEMYVAERLIDAVCALQYPTDRLQIQVLDDSTDETRDIVAACVARHRQCGVDIEHLHRRDREGYKAGALEAGLDTASGELIAVFDADFVPTSDFLQVTVPYFQDAEIGMVQARWEHLNRESGLLTRVQAIFLDGHFLIEHTARNREGCFFNFNGTAGIWRRRAIEEAGGWQHDTLTEDLDLSYRAQLAGWRFLYLPDLAVPSELPADIRGFKSQQHRWAKGSVQTGRKLVWRVLRASLPWRVKSEALVHLTNNGAYLLMLLLSLLVFPAMYLRRGQSLDVLLWIDLPLFVAATGSVLLFYMVSQMARGDGWARRLWQLPSLMGIGIGLSVNNSRAVVGGLFQRGGVFHRTPKYRLQDGSSGAASGVVPKAPVQYRARRNVSEWVEGLLALYLTACCVAAIYYQMWFSLPFLFLFWQGYCYMFALSLRGARPVLPARVPA